MVLLVLTLIDCSSFVLRIFQLTVVHPSHPQKVNIAKKNVAKAFYKAYNLIKHPKLRRLDVHNFGLGK